MGDRGNIAVLQSNKNQVWLYSHWGGSDLPETIRDGLKLASDSSSKHPQSRWKDESYLTRTLFHRALRGFKDTELTGFGISCRMQDNEHDINVVDIPKQRVFTMPEVRLKDGKVPDGYEPEASFCWSFDDYCKLEPVKD